SQNCAERIGYILSGQWRRRTMHRLKHRGLSRMNIPAGRHAKAALQPGREVGNDIAKHVIGQYHVERTWISDHLLAQRIHVHVFVGDSRVLAADFLEHALPESAGVSHGVRFVAHQDTLPRLTVLTGMTLTVLEGETNDPLHSLSRIDVFLYGYFV